MKREIKRIWFITRNWFTHGWKNLPFWFLPISWIMAPFGIIVGYFLLEDYLMGINENEYKGNNND